MRMAASNLTTEDVENIYELTYKYQMLKQEAALGDFGLPQQLPDTAYVAFEKIKQDLNSKLEAAYPDIVETYDDWLQHHEESADEELYTKSREDVDSTIANATSYDDFLDAFTHDDVEEALISINSEFKQFSTLAEMIDYSETLGPAEEKYLFQNVKDYLAQHPALDEIIEEQVERERESYYGESAIEQVRYTYDQLESWQPGDLDDNIRIFQEALTTAHNNGSMAEYLLGNRYAVKFLSELSDNPAYAEKWNQDLAKLLGYPVGSRDAPKQEWFSAHLKQAIRMIAAALRRLHMATMRVEAQQANYSVSVSADAVDEDGVVTDSYRVGSDKQFDSIEEVATFLVNEIRWRDYDWDGNTLIFISPEYDAKYKVDIISHGGEISEQEQDELHDYLPNAQTEPKKELYNCPSCDRDLPEDYGWKKIVTQRQTWDSPEEAEYVCKDCFESGEEDKAQDKYDRMMDDNW